MTAETPDLVSSLDDRSTILAVEELVHELRRKLPDAEREVVSSEDDAHSLVAAALAAVGEPYRPPGHEPAPATVAELRDLLRIAAQDETTAATARPILQDPPRDHQMAINAVLMDPLVLGAVVALLQTRLRIDVKRTDGKTSFVVRLDKQAASQSLIQDFLHAITRLLPGAGDR
jgi:hypothetical protein